jgi:signal transduction histidine kinase
VAVDQAAFRIIQESLTNVVRHAGASHATVRVIRRAGMLTVEVSDDGPAVSVPSDGNGIRGMREPTCRWRKERFGDHLRRSRRRSGPGPDGPARPDRVRR